MTKSVNDFVLDAALQYLATNGSRLDVCSAAPTTYAEATSTYTLATVALDSDDYTVANGDTSGRKATIGVQSGLTVTNTDTATHLAITNGSDTLLFVTETNSVSLSSDGTVDVAAVDISELRDPA